MAQTQQSIKTVNGGGATVVADAPLPKLNDGYILAETKAVGLNPTDWKHMRDLTVPGSTLGCDWSGIVLKVGKGVTRFKPGDEVWGLCNGGHNTHLDYGAYARYIVCIESATVHKPANLSWEQAANLGVGTNTIGQVMYGLGGLPEPKAQNLSKPPTKDILIYGASSGTGRLAIQFAKLSGYRVLATSSPSNHAALLDLGADLVYDYRDPSSIAAIKAEVKDDLDYILDCIGGKPCAEYCAQLLSSKGGHYHCVSFPVGPRFKELRPEDSVRATSALAYTMLGERLELLNGLTFEVDQEEYRFAKKWSLIVEDLLQKGLFKPLAADIRPGGLRGVLDGIYEMMNKGGPSGRKIVYPMQWS